MGSGDWFKTIITRKKVKVDKSKQSKGSSASDKPTGSKTRNKSEKKNANGGQNSSKTNGAPVKLTEDVAATRIQTAFRAYLVCYTRT
ncbi:hypothetical protein RDABS01_037195 [Bienertia sinuspersici]